MLSSFWIIGIVVNVTLTGLAIWYVVRQMRLPVPAPVKEESPPEE